MKKTILLKTIIDFEPQAGVIARTYYEEAELDNLARTLAGSTGLVIDHGYWVDSDKTTKEYVTREVADVQVPEETQETQDVNVDEIEIQSQSEITKPVDEIPIVAKSAKKRR